MAFEGPPLAACWMHQGLRSGFEVSYFTPERAGFRIEGTTAGFQDDESWVVNYDIGVDQSAQAPTLSSVNSQIIAGITDSSATGA